MSFAEFKKDIDVVNAEIAELSNPKEGQGEQQERKEVTDGTYNCELLQIDIVPAKSDGAPMLKVEFAIKEGEFKNCHLWKYQKLANTKNDSFAIWSANKFIESMMPSEPVVFNGDFDEYAIDVAKLMFDFAGCTFSVEQETKNGYKNYKVLDVFN